MAATFLVSTEVGEDRPSGLALSLYPPPEAFMNHRYSFAGLLLLAIASAALLGGCATDESTRSGADTTSQPTSVHVVAATGGTVTDPGGMTTLVIPPGALAEDTDVTVEILPAAGGAVSEISELGPDGLTFLLPATLTIKGDAALAPEGKTLALAVKEAAGFVALPGSIHSDGAASAPIMHFSQYGLILVDGEPGTTDGGGVDAGTDDSSASGDAGGVDAGSVDAGSADAGTLDAGAVDAGGADTGGGTGGCDLTGGLPAPAPGTAVMVATFSDASADYNGSLEPFTGLPEFGVADNGGQSRWLSFNKQQAANDPTLRQITVAIEAMPAACVPYVTTTSPAVLPYVQYFEGANLTHQWWCGGPVIVDTIDGPFYTFHFDLVCAPSPVLDAAGAVTMTGKGAGTFK